LKKKSNTIPVYDLCTLHRTLNLTQLHHDVVGGTFAKYLKFGEFMIAPHRHTFYHILLFTKGTGKQTIDFEQFDIHPGQIYFMIPGQVHYWEFTGEIDGYLVNFNENIFPAFIPNPLYLEQFPFLRGIPSESVIDLEGENLDESTYFLRQLIAEINKKDSFSIDMVCYGLMSLFISITRHTPGCAKKQIPDQKQMTLYNFRKLVNQFFTEKKLPREYASMLFITPNHLNAISKELLGKPAGEVIRDRILLEAKRLLVNADLSISEIAFKLNFTDSSYFTKFFKKYAATTPEEFRTSHS